MYLSVRGCLTEKLIFEQRPEESEEVNHGDIWD